MLNHEAERGNLFMSRVGGHSLSQIGPDVVVVWNQWNSSFGLCNDRSSMRPRGPLEHSSRYPAQRMRKTTRAPGPAPGDDPRARPIQTARPTQKSRGGTRVPEPHPKPKWMSPNALHCKGPRVAGRQRPSCGLRGFPVEDAWKRGGGRWNRWRWADIDVTDWEDHTDAHAWKQYNIIQYIYMLWNIYLYLYLCD